MDPEGALEEQRRLLLELILPVPTLTGPEVAALAGMDHNTAQQVWRAIGMANVEDDALAFSEWDVETLKIIKRIGDIGYPLQDFISSSRLVGRAMSRITDAHTRVMRERLMDPLLESSSDPDVAFEQLQPVLQQLLELTAPLLVYAYRRHLAVAVQQMSTEEAGPGSERLAAGFVDLVAFSKLSDDLQEADLSELIAHFEQMAMEACIDAGVRLVKIVGDSVMFVTRDPRAALEAARSMVESVDADDALPAARAGLDYGQVLPRGGDYFGRPVNVAARVTALARPSTILVTQGFLEGLGDTDTKVTRLAPRRLKNVGRVAMFRVGGDRNHR